MCLCGIIEIMQDMQVWLPEGPHIGGINMGEPSGPSNPNDPTTACFDVYYYNGHARACSIVFKSVPHEKVLASYCEIISPVHRYIPGQFYKRELPCILKVYEKINENFDLIIIDGFVTLGNRKKGLGAYLYESLGRKKPIIGVAKTFYYGCDDYISLYRGKSRRPLYITSIGVGLDSAAEFVKNLSGMGRIPDILKRVDRLSRIDSNHI